MASMALENSNNILLIADGVGQILRWSGFDASAEPAGVLPPISALSMAVSGIGNIVGTYFAYSRFVDRFGNVSNLSPVSAQLDARGGRTVQITGATNSPSALISAATNATPIVCTSAAHGRATGQVVRITGGLGNTAVNGTWTITVINANSFSLQGSAGNGAYTANSATWKLSTTITITTAVPHNIQVGAAVVITGVLGNTDANGTWLVLTVPSSTTFNINQLSGGNGAYTGGGIITTGTFGIVQDASPTTPIVITSNGHGLTTGLTVKITDVLGNVDANGTWTVTVLSANTFSLNGSSGLYAFAVSPAAIWTSGALTINYTNFPVPVEPKVVRRQILRNTDGQAITFYVDVDTTSLLSTTASSTRGDDELSAQEAVPLFDVTGAAVVNLHTVPPNWKSIVKAHQDRMFYFGEVAYAEGNVVVTNGSPTVTGIATEWQTTLAGRFIYVDGAPKSYQISSVSGQTITLSENYLGPTSNYSFYSIRPAPAERKLVYYCVDDETEMLTKRGWLARTQVTTEDEALTINPKTNQIEWQPILAINQFDFDGEMNHWHNERFDAMTTDDHRWLCKGSGIIGGHWSLRQERSCFDTSKHLSEMHGGGKRIISGGGDPVNKTPIHEDRLVELAGWYITDGTAPKIGKSIRVYQSVKSSHHARLAALSKEFSNLGCTSSEHPTKINMGWSDISIFYFGKGVGRTVRKMCPNKELTPELLVQLSSSQLRLLFETLIDGDVTRHKNGGTPVFFQKNTMTTDSFQMLCAMLGMRSYSRWRDFSKWTSSFKRKDGTPVGGWSTTAYRVPMTKLSRLCREKVHYSGKVWCPTTLNGTWMARRNGCTYWTGNSEAGLPESVPATNAFALEEDNDDLTGGMSYRSFLYLFERRHIYRLTFQEDPATDGAVYLTSQRGCVNDRCWQVAEDGVYMLDEQGVHVFDGGEGGQSVSDNIQSIFRQDANSLLHINWSAQRFFHSMLYKSQGIIRWFVVLAGDYLPRHALCYAYKTQKWWIEEFKVPVGSSVIGRIGPANAGWQTGIEQMYLGSEAKRILSYWTGQLDGQTGGTGRGTATSSGWFSLSDNQANFLTDLVGLPVTITGGKGKAQTRIISAATTTKLTISWPWSILPDSTSTYQIGGVPWLWRSGSHQVAPGEGDQQQGLEVVFSPVLTDGVTMDMRRTLDLDDIPENSGVTFTSDQQMGVATIKGQPDMIIDLKKLKGFAKKFFSGRREGTMDGIRRIRMELRGVTCPEPVSIYRVGIDGVEK